MLSEGQQLRRTYEKEKIEALGFKVYNPSDDESINDKKNAKQDGLAERIVENDTRGISESHILVFDYLPHAQGTLTELGYVQAILREMKRGVYKVYNPPLVFVQCTDIRQGNGHIPTESDRFEFSINQYVYGVILEVTEGRGIQSFDEILEMLKEIKR
ncbi:putative nucleoside 2-deoxyribosyltransferase [Staphylococcus phage CUB-EPI_14]|nr:putative nucleoside 2-deoxyribosyltransferase [Staphylococcus phage CUB-EPI_14]